MNVVETNQNLSQNLPSENINHQPIAPNQNSIAPKTNSANAKNQNTIAPESKPEITPKKEPELANLMLPKFLKDLEPRQDDKLLGVNDLPTQKITIISPNATAVRDASPVLTWQNVANIEGYEVVVFDENDNPLSRNSSVGGNSWRVSNLPKGKIYHWQVFGKSVSTDGKMSRFIGQGKFYVVSESEENRITQAKNSLERGKAFAEAGLLREAALEFRKYLKENSNSETAKKFLRQVEQAQ